MRSAPAKCHCGLGAHMRRVQGRLQLRLGLSSEALMCGVCEGGCSCWSLERKAASLMCWQPPIDCRPSAGCSSEPMALLRRLLALSCDRQMRNASAVSALICGVCEGGCSCWSRERKAASSVCWQPAIDCRPSAGCSSEPVALLRRLLAAIGTCEMPLRSRLSYAAFGLLTASNRLQAVCWVQ